MESQLFEELRKYPQQRWGMNESQRWLELTDSLSGYRAPPQPLTLDQVRKWELVSAIQKSIRRADKALALRLISAMHNLRGEHSYFWRRLCVIACEDIGPADDTLAKFVVACATLFAPRRVGQENCRLWCFLVEQMCDLPIRSRIYCSYGTLDPAIAKSELPRLDASDTEIIGRIVEQKRRVMFSEDPWHSWQKKNDWRAESLLKFVDMPRPTVVSINEAPLPAHKMLFDLPSYAYDVHTRVGLEVLRRLVRGVPGAEAIRELLSYYQVKNAHRALGEALFSVEGGRIQRELVSEPLSSLEQRLFAHQYGLPLDQWWKLRSLVQSALEEGIVDRVREEVLNGYYGQGKLQLIANSGELIRNTTN